MTNIEENTDWVCENHPDRLWGGLSDAPEACDCGAGMLRRDNEEDAK